jgi:hypothetical protein
MNLLYLCHLLTDRRQKQRGEKDNPQLYFCSFWGLWEQAELGGCTFVEVHSPVMEKQSHPRSVPEGNGGKQPILHSHKHTKDNVTDLRPF